MSSLIWKEKVITLEPGRFLNYKDNKEVKDTHREKAPSNKTPALTNSTNWVVGTSNQLFLRGS